MSGLVVNTDEPMSSKKSRKGAVPFPEGDTLSVIFSFLTTWEILRGQFYLVNKEWQYVLLNWPNAWGSALMLYYADTYLGKCSSYLHGWRQIKVRLNNF